MWSAAGVRDCPGELTAWPLRGALKGGGAWYPCWQGGVDVPYPKENRFLYQDVAAVGALISEYPPGTPHRAEQFPIRNRLISGLSLGVVAVECARFSGTMRTIDHALDQNRDVFAVPGNIDAPMSQGPNWLIQQGARPVTCGEDILADYWDQFPQKLAHAKALEPEHLRQRLELPAKAQKEEPKPEPQQEKSKESLVVLRSPCLSSGSASPRISWWYFMLCWRGQTPPTCWWTAPRFRPGGCCRR